MWGFFKKKLFFLNENFFFKKKCDFEDFFSKNLEFWKFLIRFNQRFGACYGFGGTSTESGFKWFGSCSSGGSKPLVLTNWEKIGQR